ncbi:restriction endonuclease subunit S [Acinetobacter schindleri]|nr:restriction endonuclease subunit S [Acinetobacter schindleri]
MALTKKISDIIKEDTTGLLSKHHSWLRIELKDIAEVLNGFAFSSSHFNNDGIGLPLIRIRDVIEGHTTTYYNGNYEDIYLVNKNEILVGMDGDFNLGLWKSLPSLLNQRVCKISVKNDNYYDKQFLIYLLPSYLKAINDATSSITVKHLSSKTLSEILLPLPPLNEQKRIADKIDELFSELDNGIEELETAQKKLELYRQSLLKSAVEGELSKEWRQTQTEVSETGEQLLARILKERRERWEQEKLKEFAEKGKNPPKNWQDKYPEPVQPDTENLPQLPEGWVWASLDMLLQNIKAGKSFRCEERPPKEDEIGVVKVSAVSWGEYNEMESKTCLDATKINSDYYIKENDFLMSRANTIQLVGACVISRDVNLTNMLSDKILRLDFIIESLIFKNWILHLMRSKIGREQIEASATGNQESMKNISQDSIKKITVPLPPTDEIKFLIKELSEKFNSIQDTSNLLSMNFDNLVPQRKNILKDAFTGKLVPQDESDESASILLERIQAEREVQAANVKKKSRKKDQKSNLELIVPKTDEDKLKVVIDAISSFENQTFSAQDLSNKCMLNYEDFSDILFNLLSEENPVIEQLFDTKIKAMRLKKI